MLCEEGMITTYSIWSKQANHGIYDNDRQTQWEIVVEQNFKDGLNCFFTKLHQKDPCGRLFDTYKNDEIHFDPSTTNNRPTSFNPYECIKHT